MRYVKQDCDYLDLSLRLLEVESSLDVRLGWALSQIQFCSTWIQSSINCGLSKSPTGSIICFGGQSTGF